MEKKRKEMAIDQTCISRSFLRTNHMVDVPLGSYCSTKNTNQTLILAFVCAFHLHNVKFTAISFHPSWLHTTEPEKLKDKTRDKSDANLSHDSFWEN